MDFFDVGPYFILLWMLVGGLVGFFLGMHRGRGETGLVLGALLGIIGWLLILVGPDLRKRCPTCRGVIPDESATKCMHCGELVELAPIIPVMPVKCPACSTRITVEIARLGEGIHCPKCNVGFVPQPAK